MKDGKCLHAFKIASSDAYLPSFPFAKSSVEINDDMRCAAKKLLEEIPHVDTLEAHTLSSEIHRALDELIAHGATSERRS